MAEAGWIYLMHSWRVAYPSFVIHPHNNDSYAGTGKLLMDAELSSTELCFSGLSFVVSASGGAEICVPAHHHRNNHDRR